MISVIGMLRAYCKDTEDTGYRHKGFLKKHVKRPTRNNEMFTITRRFITLCWGEKAL